MKTTEFIDHVARQEGFASHDEARDATRATLTSLSQLVTQGEAEDLADQLPDVLGHIVSSTKDKPQGGATFGRAQFLDAVADRMTGAADREQAETSARRVFTALRDAVTPGEWDDFASQLPTDLEPVLH